jgi:hypothetical protein
MKRNISKTSARRVQEGAVLDDSAVIYAKRFSNSLYGKFASGDGVNLLYDLHDRWKRPSPSPPLRRTTSRGLSFLLTKIKR